MSTRQRRLSATPTSFNKSWVVFGAILLGVVLVMSACDMSGGSDPNQQNSTEAQRVNQQQQLYQHNQPFPFFNYSVERDELSQIYVAREQAVDTYSVVYSMGRAIWSCPSKGYPIPYTDQLTNPQAVDPAHDYNNWGAVLPQAEPNGLYTGATSATWIMCVRTLPGGGTEIVPVYAEPEVVTYPFPVKIVDGQVVHAGDPSGTQIKLNSQAASSSLQATPTPSK